MNKIAMAIHGGASEATELLRSHLPEYEESLKVALYRGYDVLQQGGSALDAVEASVRQLEDDPLFNAGRGSVLNSEGQVEMDASIMDGHILDAGAVSMVQEVKNPISLARKIMTQTHHVFLSGYGALAVAKLNDLELKSKDYFVTEYQYGQYLEASKRESTDDIFDKKLKGR